MNKVTKLSFACFFFNDDFTIGFLGLCSRLVGGIGLLERSPLEVSLVPSTLYLAPFALKAGWFGLIAFQTFGLAGDTAWRVPKRKEQSAPCASFFAFETTKYMTIHSTCSSLQYHIFFNFFLSLSFFFASHFFGFNKK